MSALVVNGYDGASGNDQTHAPVSRVPIALRPF
jgi:hypothetical protein